MARTFMDDNVFLETRTAAELYKACRNEPIYDYHCHLSSLEIANNGSYKNLTEAWLGSLKGGDHYKWRMMRAMGIEERLITGDADDYQKFLAWARTIENLIGNPLYHWTHLELKRYFDIHKPLTEKTAPAIWEKANALLKTPALSVKGIFEKFKVHTAGTTDDPADSLEYHKTIACGSAPIGKIETKVIPTFRPDKALDLLSEDFPAYIDKLSNASGIRIKTYIEFLTALENRLDFFIQHGCRSSDHGFEYIPGLSLSVQEIQDVFAKALSGKSVSVSEADSFKFMTLVFLSGLYAKKNIVMQIHSGILRNINTKSFSSLGANTGFDAINDPLIAKNTAELLNLINHTGDSGAPKIILYSANPKDYYPFAAIMGSFQQEGIRGGMQLGCAWWFCDTRDGIEEHLRTTANLGILPSFIGMLTDSRSFLSFPRHEYFRRILCNLIGKWVENGEYHADMEKLEQIVKDIAFNNAFEYFGPRINTN